MKKISIFLFFISTIWLLSSCKKEVKPLISKDVGTQPSQKNLLPPQAYPANMGEFENYNMKDGSVITLQKVNGEFILGGDIILSPAQLQIIKDNSVVNKPKVTGLIKTQSTFTNSFNKLWPTGKVYYTINNSVNLSNISYAINYWNTHTQIQLIPRTNQTNYVEFSPAPSQGAGDSQLGMIGGKQLIRLIDGVDYGGIIHEIGHTLGLMHEQSREDRAGAIKVNLDNINSNWIAQYQVFSGINGSGFEIGPFDFESIMLYPSDNPDARINGNIAYQMTKLDNTPFYGQRYYLSAGDIAGINYLYFNSTFCKFRFEVLTSVEDSYRSNIVYATYADFYSDAQCTIPKTLTNPIQFHAIVSQTSYDIPDRPTNTNTGYLTTLQPGANSYPINVNVYQDYNFTYDGSMVQGSSASFAGVAGGVGYIGVN